MADENRPVTEIAGQLATLTRTLLDVRTVADALTRVVAATAELVPGTDLVSVTLRDPDGRFHTPFETDAVAAELDEVQYEAGHGPCLDCARESGPAYAYNGDLSDAPEWPVFAPAAVDRGFRSVLSTALNPMSDQDQAGALNVYAKQPNGFSEESRDRALLLATHAALALAATGAYERFALEREQLRTAIESRDVIGQAKGILMQRRGLTADEAFRLLAKTSQDLNVKLADVARTLTDRHTELG
jgi:transcriptional regulator with GAF, ATPase, and Fis domain